MVPKQFLVLSHDETCSICCEQILGSDKKFGLLENCKHFYCFDCIKTWESQKLKSGESLKCPMCWAKFWYVLPSHSKLTKED